MNTKLKRLDVYLTSERKDFSRSFYQKFIKEFGVRVNGKIQKKPHFALEEDDIVEKPSEHELKKFLKCFDVDESVAVFTKDQILYSGKNFVVINKPAGVRTESLAIGLYAVHRLDKDTSGVLVIAKNPTTQAALQAQWKGRSVKKTYIALIKGILNPREGVIEGSIFRSIRDRRKMSVSKSVKAREAMTGFKVIAYFDASDTQYREPLTLVRAFPKTGRTHQIRVHFASIHHPIIGDAVYGDRAINKYFDKEFGLKRQFLHAEKLSLKDPNIGKRVTFEAPLPEELKKVLDYFVIPVK